MRSVIDCGFLTVDRYTLTVTVIGLAFPSHARETCIMCPLPFFVRMTPGHWLEGKGVSGEDPAKTRRAEA